MCRPRFWSSTKFLPQVLFLQQILLWLVTTTAFSVVGFFSLPRLTRSGFAGGVRVGLVLRSGSAASFAAGLGGLGTRAGVAAFAVVAVAEPLIPARLDGGVRSYIRIRAHWAILCTSFGVAILLMSSLM